MPVLASSSTPNLNALHRDKSETLVNSKEAPTLNMAGEQTVEKTIVI